MASITRATGKLAFPSVRSYGTPRNQSKGLSALLQSSSTNSNQRVGTYHEPRRFSSAIDTYYKQKEAAKELRSTRYHERKAHEENVKSRRNGRPKNTRKKKFMAWFKPKAKREHHHNHKARKLALDWKLQVAVVLERLPIVLPDTPKWQEDYDNLRTYLDQFGREYPKELYGSMEIEELEDLTTEAILETHLPRGFTPAPRETEADNNGDVRTLDRRLKTWVYLTVNESVRTPEGEKNQWRLPTVEVKGEETLLDAAKRAIREKVGDCMDIYYPSNCPMTMDMLIFKDDERAKNGNAYGVKTFFMVVQYDDGKVTADDLFVEDYAWFEKSELVQRIEEQEGEDKSKLYFYLLNA